MRKLDFLSPPLRTACNVKGRIAHSNAKRAWVVLLAVWPTGVADIDNNGDRAAACVGVSKTLVASMSGNAKLAKASAEAAASVDIFYNIIIDGACGHRTYIMSFAGLCIGEGKKDVLSDQDVERADEVTKLCSYLFYLCVDQLLKSKGFCVEYTSGLFFGATWGG